MPEDLQKLLNVSQKAKAAYEALPYSCRKEYVLWIFGVKRDETLGYRVKKSN
ncbi:MAG: YdeI/OmpD-associated family protein [Bacteroidetes bacterium]|nr:YdeI/OmpD-associated family protein [Bacteroidota bacterium]